MASQQELLSALQGLARQSYTNTRPQPVAVEPTSRTATPPRMGAGGAPNLFDTVVKRSGTTAGGGLTPKTRMAKNSLDMYARGAGMRAPNVLDKIQAAAEGESEPSGALGVVANVLNNPIAKTILKPLEIIDIPRRAIISGIREVTDILDTDEKTQASFGDWFKQTQDVTYGFGTAFPMEGWGGRIVGLIGDLALDPINYLTLGTNIPKSLAVRGLDDVMRGALLSADEIAAMGPEAVARMAASETARVAASKEGVKLRTLLGRRQTGRGYATNLAKLADKMGSSPELVQQIALRGRSALNRTEEGIQLANKIGLPDSGLYVAGTRVRVPFSGPTAEFIERGLVGARVGIMGSRSAEWLAENFTTKGTSAARNMQPLRRGLRTGKMTVEGRTVKMDPQLARFAVRLETADNAARALEGTMLDVYAKRVQPFLQEQDIVNAGPELYKFLDTPKFNPDGTLNWERELTSTEQIAYDKVKALLQKFHEEVEAKYRQFDPSFELKWQENYLPHMMTDEARDWLNSLSTARAEEIRQYLKTNMTDPASSFKSRGLVEDAKFFGVELTGKDVRGGVARLNEIANMPGSGFSGKFFETDLDRIMAKYGQHYSSQFGTAEFMRLAIEGGVLAEAKQMGSVTKDWLKQTADYARAMEKGMLRAHSEMRDSGRAVIKALTDYMDELRGPSGQIGKELTALQQGLREYGTPENALKKLEAAKLLVDKAAEKQKKAWFNFVNARSSNTALIDNLRSTVEELDLAWNDLAKSIDQAIVDHPKLISELGVGIDTPAGEALVSFGGEVLSIDGWIRKLDSKVEVAADKLLQLEQDFARISKLDNYLNGVMEGRLVYFPDEGIMENLQAALALEGVEIKDMLSMTKARIAQVWSPNKIDDNMKAIKSVIDPTNSITNAGLSRLTIDDVMRRVTNAVGSTANLRELREAGVWLIVRDAINDPDFAATLAKDIKNIGSGLDGATQSRYSNLVELLRQADATERYIFRNADGMTGNTQLTNLESNIMRAEDDLREINLYIEDETVEGLAVGSSNVIERYYIGEQDINVLNKRIDELNNKIKKWQERADKIKKNLTPYETTAITKANELNGFRDVIADLGAGISEYYLHRETYARLRSLQDALSPNGMIVDQSAYTKILSDVARPELVSTIQQQKGIVELEEFFTNLRTRVESVGQRGAVSEKQVAEIRQSLLEQEVVYPEMVSQTKQAGKRAKTQMQTTVPSRSEYVETGRTLTDGKGRWRPGPNGKDKIWNQRRAELEAAGATKQEIDNAYRTILDSTVRYKETTVNRTFTPQKELGGEPTARAQLSPEEQVVMKPTGRKIVEKAGQWGPRKEELLAKQTARSSDITRSITLMEELSKVFRVKPVGKKGAFQPKEVKDALRIQELLREHLPELEAVWLRDKVADVNRLFYRHPESIVLEEEVLSLLRQYGKRPTWGRGKIRAARAVRGKGSEADSFGDLQGFRAQSDSVAGQYDKLSGDIKKAIDELKTIKVPYTAKRVNPLKQKIKELETMYNRIVSEVEADRVIAKEAGKKLTGQTSLKGINQAINKAIRGGKEYGYSQIFNNAAKGSEKYLADFFSELLGGQTYNFSGTRGVRQYREIQKADSFFAKLNERASSRIKGLHVLVDEANVPLDVLLQGTPGVSSNGKYIPGAWLMRKELRGANAAADFLEEYADELLRKINYKKEINTSEKAAGRELARLEGTVPEIGPPKSRAPFVAKLNEEISMEIPDQGRIMRRVIREELENNVILQQLDEIASTPDYARATRRESEHRFAMVLAKLDETTAQELGFTPPEFRALWNDPLRPVEINKLRSQLSTLEKTRARLIAQRNSVIQRRGSEYYATNIDVQLERVETLLLQVEEQVLEHQAAGSALNKLANLHDNFADFARQQENSYAFKFKKGPNGDEALSPEAALQQLLDREGSRVLSTEVEERVKMLRKKRLDSDEYKVIKEYRTTQEKLNYKMQQDWMNNRSNIVNFQDRLRARISGLRGQSVETEDAIARLEQSIFDELEPTRLRARSKGGERLAQEAKGLAESMRTRPSSIEAGEWSKLTDAELQAQLGGMSIERGATQPNKYFRTDSGAIEAGTTPKQLEIAAKKSEIDEANEFIASLNLKKAVIEGRQEEVLKSLRDMSDEQRKIVAKTLQAERDLKAAQEQGQKLAVGRDKRKLVKVADEKRLALTTTQDAMAQAQKAYDGAVSFSQWGPEALEDARKTVQSLKDMSIKGRTTKAKIKAGEDTWAVDVEQFVDEATNLINTVDGNDLPNNIRAAVTDYTNKRAEHLKRVEKFTQAQEEAAYAKGLKGMEYTTRAGSKMPIALRGRVPEESYQITTMFDEGFVQLSKYFPNIQVKAELASIVQSVHRLNEPQMVRELSRFMGKYTRFFKAYATLSPGFHVRNAMSNSFMIFAAGGDIRYMTEGLNMSRSWLEASKRGENIEQWISSLPANMQTKAKTAMDAFMASGGGISSDFFDYTRLPRGTKKSKELGRWVENHSRFVLAWDGVSKGLDMDAASVRVRKYLIDYTDISTADQYMRQIIPFWMWTSRNLPLQLGNMWLNPRAYAIYNNIKRNLSDSEEDEIIPQWMNDIGAFKLPFGKNIYATPDFGFNRVGQQVQELADPTRFLSNVNPLLRVPVELMGGRQLYSNRQFSDKPVEVGDGAGALLQPLLALAGYGETRNGKQFVDDKAYYALRNLIPFLGTAERLTPSIDTYQQRGYVNPLLGFLGVPGRQVKEQEVLSEIKRRKGNISKITAREKAFGE